MKLKLWHDPPLSWLQLSHNWSRFLVAVAGISFATLLMFMQLGFQGALYKTATDIHSHFLADIVLTGPRTENFFDAGLYQPFTKRYLAQARQIEGVASVAPLYVGFGHWKNPTAGINRQILIFGFDPEKPAFDLPEVQQHLEDIKRADVILFDRMSKSDYGPIASAIEDGYTVTTEINNRRVEVRGLFSLGGSIFSASGIVITSDLNFARLVQRPLSHVSVGLIRLEPGANASRVLQALGKLYSGGVRVQTLQRYMEREKLYWQQSSPIGSIFTIGTVMGFVVGLVIVYQVLYSEVSDNLSHYATLKALGYSQGYFYRLILQQSVLLSCLGYFPGFLLSLLLYNAVVRIVRLPAEMEVLRAIYVFILTALMCCVAGFIATKKLREADPADIF
jgi:putative ABC transport system permease protein